MTNAERELQDEDGGRYGDPRRCRIHGTATSSPDGMFDGLCGACEAASDDDCDPPTNQQETPMPASPIVLPVTNPPGLIDALNAYVRACAAKNEEWMSACSLTIPRDTFSVKILSAKWAKIIREGAPDHMGRIGSRSVHSFVALSSFVTKQLGAVTCGDIHKAAGWSAPAKHARGSVFASDNGASIITSHGVAYLR